MATPVTFAFMGASTGVGLSALKHSLAAGFNCVALCRDPSKLTAILPLESNPNLRVLEGNAHDIDAVSRLIQKPDGSLVDKIISTIGTRPSLHAKGGFGDHKVCQKGMSTLLAAIDQLRKAGAAGRPYIVACGTTGISKFGRDVPLLMVPLYHWGLKIPHADKVIMEERLVASGEEFTIVHCSLLTNGESNTNIRVGIEDPQEGTESKAIGYTISREDAGKWFADNLLVKKEPRYINKIAKITY